MIMNELVANERNRNLKTFQKFYGDATTNLDKLDFSTSNG